MIDQLYLRIAIQVLAADLKEMNLGTPRKEKETER